MQGRNYVMTQVLLFDGMETAGRENRRGEGGCGGIIIITEVCFMRTIHEGTHSESSCRTSALG